jgi:hypothetical protein
MVDSIEIFWAKVTGHGPLLKSMTALLISHVACDYIIIWNQCHISNDKIDNNLH